MVDVAHYHQLEQELSQLRKKVKTAARSKEQWFKKKESLKQDIKMVSQEIQQTKNQSNEQFIALKDVKKERDKYNDEVKRLISHIKKVKDEKQKTKEKYQDKISPDRLLKRINALEQKVEVEVDFKREQKLMDEIKKLKKQYEESANIHAVLEQEKAISHQIKEAKKKADEFHKKVVELSQQNGYGPFADKVDKLIALKKEQETAFQKFIDDKNTFIQLQSQLKKKQDEFNVLQKEIDQHQEIRKELRKVHQYKKLEEQSKKVEEKLKQKKKLTTEDVLAFQGGSESEA